MSGFSKMNRVTWKFYLTALLLLLLLTGADSFYVCVEDNSQYEGRLFAYGMENRQILFWKKIPVCWKAGNACLRFTMIRWLIFRFSAIIP